MQKIKKTYHIKAPAQKVWEALTDPKLIDQWGGGPAQMSAQADAQFKLWGGDIWGKNTKVEPDKLLEQDWNSRDMKQGSMKVVFRLHSKDNETALELTHSEITTEKKRRDYADGWDNYYIGALKELVEKNG